jgi:ABC-type amino acid transport system permease subunit
MVMNLLFGLPDERPGGLVLTIIYALGSGGIGLALGLAYASIGVLWKRASLALQGASAFLRGVPLLLLVFLTAHLAGLTTGSAGLLALSLYSFAHVGEILRSFLAAYPAHLADQARVIGIFPLWEWLLLRIPWTLRYAWAAISTHWISLLKDTGALVILGFGELTTVAKALGETPANYDRWGVVFALAATLYLVTTFALIQMLRLVERRMMYK